MRIIWIDPQGGTIDDTAAITWMLPSPGDVVRGKWDRAYRVKERLYDFTSGGAGTLIQIKLSEE